MKIRISLLVLLFASAISFAQYDEYNPELDWYTIKGKYCQVHFHDGAERSARVTLKIADEIYEPMASLYQYEPGVIHFVLKDMDDFSNGATYFFDNKIEIWASSLDFDLRGNHNWLRNVITHETAHMFQIQSGMKTSRSLPAIYLQWLNYEDRRRPDILYGFPNIIASYPIPSINIPAWFAEGTAQYMRKDFNYDNWDSHRDMILRSYALDGKLLTWNQMGVFGKTSLGNESVYNSGFALTRYISQKYGEGKLRDITHSLGTVGNFTMDAAISDVLGISGNDLYNEWKTFITDDYRKRTETIRQNLVAGTMIDSAGFGNFHPIFSPDGKKIYYLSNQNADYLGLTALFAYDIESKESELINAETKQVFSFIPKTNSFIFSKLTDDNPNGYKIHDLYLYDIDTEEETRLTENLRANYPSVSNDGKKIVFLFQKDGTTNLGIVDIDGKNFRALTSFKDGEQMYNPKFSPDDSYIICDYSYHHGRDLARINTDGTGFTFFLQTDSDERNPVFAPDGTIIYASDKTGIFNLYSYDLKTSESKQITNVLGGAFMPAVNANGDIAYAGYTSGGYKIFHLKSESKTNVPVNACYTFTKNPPLGADKPLGDMTSGDFDRLRLFNDYDYPKNEKEKYSGAFSRLTFFPLLRFDNYNTSNSTLERVKPGLYVASSDMLNRYSLFAGGAINSRLERDLFLIFEYRNALPLLFNLGIKPQLSLELYNITRKTDVDILFEEFDPINTDVTYNLFEADIIAKHKMFSDADFLELRYVFSSYTATLGSFTLPNSTTLYPTTDDTYLIGNYFRAAYKFESIAPSRDSEINPVGSSFELQYDYEMNRYNPDGEYEVVDGMLKPLYQNFDFHRIELNTWLAFETFKNHTLTARLRVGTIPGDSVPDFFDFYLGGFIGMKSYPFYAIGGNEIAWLNVTYRFPLFRDIDARIGHIYLDKIYFSVFGDIGNAWNGDMPGLSTFKKGAGAELRIAMNSFYLFPTSLFFSAAYGFDEHTRIVNKKPIKYGEEWRFYAGLLFGFSL